MTTPQDSQAFLHYLPFILDVVCFLALGGFLLSFIKWSDKSYGSLMIIVLTLSYFGYPIINIYTFFSIPDPDQKPTRIEGSIAVVISTFNLYWTAAFALFTYLVSKFALARQFPNFKKLIFLLTLACLIPTLLFPFLIYLDIWGDHVHFIAHGLKTIGCYIDDNSPALAKASFIIVRDLTGRLIPTLATSIYFFKLYNLMKNSRETKGFSRKALWGLSIVSTIPFFCAIPGVLVDFNDYFAPLYSSVPVTTGVVVFRYFWEFLNLWAYWKLYPTRERILRSKSASRTGKSLLSLQLDEISMYQRMNESSL